jgi:hypothetical protein
MLSGLREDIRGLSANKIGPRGQHVFFFLIMLNCMSFRSVVLVVILVFFI